MDASTLRRVTDKRPSRLRRIAAGTLGLLFLCLPAVQPSSLFAEETYTFDINEIEKKPYHFGGYA